MIGPRSEPQVGETFFRETCLEDVVALGLGLGLGQCKWLVIYKGLTKPLVTRLYTPTERGTQNEPWANSPLTSHKMILQVRAFGNTGCCERQGAKRWVF